MLRRQQIRGLGVCPEEVIVPVVVITRLRLRDPAFFDDFFAAAVAAVEQANASDGSLGSDVLADADNAYWTRTAWQDRPVMQRFVVTAPHLGIMDRLDEWCDEATFVDWEQEGAELPSWQTAYANIVADGQAATLTNPSPAHATRAFPPPVEPS